MTDSNAKPIRKVSNLVSFFESAPTSPNLPPAPFNATRSTSTSFLSSVPAISTPAGRRKSALDESATGSNGPVAPPNRVPVRNGIVQSHVRRFSGNSFASLEDLTTNNTNRRISAPPTLPTISTSTPPLSDVTPSDVILTASPVQIDSSDEPQPIKRAKLLGARAFRPGRLAPPPPALLQSVSRSPEGSASPRNDFRPLSSPLGGIAETVLVPATVHVVRGGEARKVEVARGKQKESVVDKVESAPPTLLSHPPNPRIASSAGSKSSTNPLVDSTAQDQRTPIDVSPISSPFSRIVAPMVVPATVHVLRGGEKRKLDIAGAKEQKSVVSEIATDPVSPPNYDTKTPEPHIDPFADPPPISPPIDSSFAVAPISSTQEIPRPAAHPLQSPDSIKSQSVSFHSSSSITQRTASAFPTRPNFESNPSSSSSVWSSKTQCLPAASLFSPGAEPLNLPELDRLIEGMDSKGFAEIEAKEVLGSEEQSDWDEYVRGRSENVRKGGGGWWNRMATRWSRNTSKDYVDMETQKPSASLLAADHRSHIFPPMHLLPPNTTVTDLLRNRKVQFLSADTVLGLALDGVIGAAGSTYGIALTQVEVFRDAIQMLSLLAQHAFATTPTSPWYFRALSVSSGDFVSAFGSAIIWLWIFMLVAALGMYELWDFTGRWKGLITNTNGSVGARDAKGAGEGFDCESCEGASSPFGRGVGDSCGPTTARWWSRIRASRGYKIGITFLVTTLYLPLAKIGVAALVWDSDYWAAPTITPDLCYNTSLTGGFNFAWIILIVAGSSMIWLVAFLPWRLYRIVERVAPRVDPFTSRGEKRKMRDAKEEYARLLEIDRQAFNFLYNSYRRPYASFKAIYLGIKFFTVLITTVFSSNNCLFLARSPTSLALIRQAVTLVVMAIFYLVHFVTQPFLDPIANRSDRVSRMSFVFVAGIGLLVALEVQGKEILAKGILATVVAITYLLNGYFALISTFWAQRIVKRMQKRLDFSIDILSPHLDLQKHIAQRIWRETLSVLLLASKSYKMPESQELNFASGRFVPPYLLEFQGTVGERHVENLQILREIGIDRFREALTSAPPGSRMRELREKISRHFTGPDILWSLRSDTDSQFGRLDIFPFPFVAVFNFDDASQDTLYLSSLSDLERVMRLNESDDARGRKQVRRALRSLDGQLVRTAYSREIVLGRRRKWWSWGKGNEYSVADRIEFDEGIFRIAKNSSMEWNGYNYSSGFTISIQCFSSASSSPKEVVISAFDLSLPSDFRMNLPLAKFLRSNKPTIVARIDHLDDLLQDHRDFFRFENLRKQETLSYDFLLQVFANHSLERKELESTLHRIEQTERVKELASHHRGVINFLDERLRRVNRNKISQFWYVFFDELWRRNRAMLGDEKEFSPWYRDSICYRPLSRRELERFFIEQGLWGGAFNDGVLNRIYFYLDEINFSTSPGTSKAIPIHLHSSSHPLIPFSSLATAVHELHPSHSSHPFHPSEPSTSAGTNIDDPTIRPRPAYTFEQIFDRPTPRFVAGERREWIRNVGRGAREGVMGWLGLRPTERRQPGSGEGVEFDLRKGKMGGWNLPRGN